MSRILQAPTQLAAIGLFALTGLAAANPMASFVDCTDSFWAIACGNEVPTYPTDVPSDDLIISSADVQPADDGLIRIDGDHVCTEIDGGAFIICETT